MGKASRKRASRADGDRAPTASARPSGAQRAATSVAPAHANLGVSLAKEGRNAEAIAAFSQAVLLNPKDATSRGRLEFLRRGGAVKTTAP